MTNPYLDLYFCIINFICGIFFFVIYFGILLIEENKKKYVIYILDFFSILIIGYVYLLVLIANKINFNIYFLIFIILGYYTGYKFLKKQLIISYRNFFIISKYLIQKFIVIFKWSIDILLINILIKHIKKIILKKKINNALNRFNKQLIKEDD